MSRDRLFGTDGVRGRANVHPMTAEMALALGQAGRARLREPRRIERRQIIIGKDTRLSGYLFEDAMAAGICSMGVDVLQVGPMPDARHGVPDRRHALRRGRDDLGAPQRLPGQRDQVLLARRVQAARRDRDADGGADPVGRARGPSRGLRTRSERRGRID
jgi:hypothetical protein